MDGVVILESFEVATAWAESFSLGSAIIAGVFMGLCGVITGLVIVGIIAGVKNLTRKSFNKLLITTLSTLGVIGLSIGLLKGGYWLPDKTPTEYETQYKIALESNVNYKEFTDKYEIIDFENDVYTVREK